MSSPRKQQQQPEFNKSCPVCGKKVLEYKMKSKEQLRKDLVFKGSDIYSWKI